MKNKSTYTTGQVAKLLGCSPSVVGRWVDSGDLSGYRLPGSRDRRIPREQLLLFLKKHGMPLGELAESAGPTVLVIGADSPTSGRLHELLEGYHCVIARNGFEAGVASQSTYPDVVVVDLSMGRTEGIFIARQLQEKVGEAHYFALSSEDELNEGGELFDTFIEVFKRPFDVTLLANAVREVVEQKSRRMRNGKSNGRRT